jgi:hypothetical protein
MRRAAVHAAVVTASITAISTTHLPVAPNLGVEVVHASDCTVHSDSRLYCGNTHDAKLYQDPNYTSPVTGVMQSTYSSFICWQYGQVNPRQNDIWYWAKGNTAQNGYSGWGYMSAYDVKTTTDPVPGLPECNF